MTAVAAVGEVVGAVRAPGPRLFATPADEPRARRASDGVELVAAALALITISVAAIPTPGFSRSIANLLRAIPSFLDSAWQILADALALLAVVIVIATILRQRWSVARDALAAVAVAVAVWLVVGRIVQDSWPAVWDSIRAASPPPWYPSPRIAVFGAVVLTVAPHLTRPARRIAGWVVLLAAVSVAALGATMPLGAVAGWLVAVIAAASIHLVFGSCAGRPSLDLVRAALAELNVPITWLGAADRQQSGLFVVNAIDTDGETLVVKVYGRDAHDASLLSTLWRNVWYREAGAPLRLGRLQQVEHEAFLTLFAAQAGVETDGVVTAGATDEDEALLVLRRRGRLLSDLRGEDAIEHIASRIWTLLDRLHRAGVAHGQVDDRHLMVVDDEVGIIDFRGAAVAATLTRRRIDEVQALVTTAALIGEERAVAVALDAIGADELIGILPFLQSTTLTPAQRSLVGDRALDLDQLRQRSAEAVGVEPPELIELRRVTLGSILRVVLPGFAIVALVSSFAGFDLGQLADQLHDARWWFVVLAFLLTQVPRLTQAISTLGSSPVPLPLGPLYALQLAASYINLAIPTTAGRIAINIRFFQRHQMPPGTAVAAGALDGFCGFIVQILVLISLLVFTSASLDLDVDRAVDSASQILVLVVAVAVVALAVLFAVGKWRRFVIRWVKRLGSEAAGALRGLRSPRRLVLLFGGNLATEVLFALAFATFAWALGFPISLGEALLINVSVALLAGLMPVPGGIGVAEGGLTFGLVQAGVPEEVAFSVALLYRMASFYLPPVWGFFALRWLERHEHL